MVNNSTERRPGMSNTLESAKDTAHDIAGSAADMASQAWDTTRKGVQDAASATAHTAAQAWDATRQGVQSAASTVSEGAEEAWDSTTGLIRRYPVAALLVAFGVGFLVAEVLQSTRRS